jgi:hypothetical protein
MYYSKLVTLNSWSINENSRQFFGYHWKKISVTTLKFWVIWLVMAHSPPLIQQLKKNSVATQKNSVTTQKIGSLLKKIDHQFSWPTIFDHQIMWLKFFDHCSKIFNHQIHHGSISTIDLVIEMFHSSL